jgi:hypothetical protein
MLVSAMFTANYTEYEEHVAANEVRADSRCA